MLPQLELTTKFTPHSHSLSGNSLIHQPPVGDHSLMTGLCSHTMRKAPPPAYRKIALAMSYHGPLSLIVFYAQILSVPMWNTANQGNMCITPLVRSEVFIWLFYKSVPNQNIILTFESILNNWKFMVEKGISYSTVYFRFMISFIKSTIRISD